MTGRAALYIGGPWAGEQRPVDDPPPASLTVGYFDMGTARGEVGSYVRLVPTTRPARYAPGQPVVFQWFGPADPLPMPETTPGQADLDAVASAMGTRGRLTLAGFGYNPVSGRDSARFALLVPRDVLPGWTRWSGLDLHRADVTVPGVVVWDAGQPDGPAAGDQPPTLPVPGSG